MAHQSERIRFADLSLESPPGAAGMAYYFSKLQLDRDIKKSRFLFVAAFGATYIFYYFMVRLSPGGLDFLLGRDLIALVSLVGLLLTFRKPSNFELIRLFVNLMSLSYFAVYLYLGYLNHWTVFYRWSYAVCTMILCSVVLRWKDFLLLAVVAELAPIPVAFGALTLLEQVHFHMANLTIFFVIGVTLRSNFQYQAELLDVSQSLLETSKTAALGRMAGGVAHEINSPLAIIQLSMERLLIEVESKPAAISADELKRMASRVLKTVDRISLIIRSLLSFAKSSPIDPMEFVSLNELFEQTAVLWPDAIRKGEVAISVEYEQDIEVLCQKSQIVQVFLHLITNSVDATEGSANRKIQIIARADSPGLLKVRFYDSGPGVLPEHLPHLTEPFFTTKPPGKGSGLGLSVSNSIIENHHGRLYYDSSSPEPCFVVELPCRASNSRSSPTEKPGVLNA